VLDFTVSLPASFPVQMFIIMFEWYNTILFSRYPSVILLKSARLTYFTIWRNLTTASANCWSPMLSLLR